MVELFHQDDESEDDSSGTSGGDDQIGYSGYGASRSRYPVHDAVEYRDIDFLKKIILVTSEGNTSTDLDEDLHSESYDSQENDNESRHSESNNSVKTKNSSSDDDSVITDSEHDNAAAAAAAMGHPPISARSSPRKNSHSTETVTTQPLDHEQEESTRSNLEDKAVRSHSANITDVIDKSLGVRLNSLSGDTIDAHDFLVSNDVTDPLACLAMGNLINQKDRSMKDAVNDVAAVSRYSCPFDLDERDDDENTPLHIAIHSCKLDHMRLLLQAGASPHRKCDGSAPIHTAISIGAISSKKSFSFDAVKLLCDYDADVSVHDDSNHTPLYLAVACNLAGVVSLILSNPIGLETLNVRSDRVGGRPLHAAAKFDNGRIGKSSQHDKNGSSHHSPQQHQRPGISNDLSVNSSDKCMVTKILLSTSGIEIDAVDNYGKTPLHIACDRGNWGGARLLVQAGADPRAVDKRGFTPAGLAYKRGMTVPSDLIPLLGTPGSGIPPALDSSSAVASKRDLIMDPDGRTLIICHELCSRHFTCPPIARDGLEPPPENLRRLSVLLNEDTGILRSSEFQGLTWEGEARRAAMVDVLKCHDYSYIEKISLMCSQLPDNPRAIALLDPDTSISRWSFEAALRAAGSVCEAVDRVMSGDFRNAFCAVRPPGHHSGPRGIVKCSNDPEGSHGFCLLNNVCIGAAYARSMYRNDGIKKIAIIDFDVHHGNGTEEIIRSLIPTVERANIKIPFVTGVLENLSYRPWLDEFDIHNVFFASVHGYGPREMNFTDHAPLGGWFYPASGKSVITDSVLSPSSVENPTLTEFLHSQTWSRMGEETRTNCCKIINVGLGLPKENDLAGVQRVEVRDSYRKRIIPHLIEFNPDIIFISAGFDAHRRDSMNFGYVGMVEDDYEWLTEQLVKVANTCCNGRIISVLEGGYKIHGGIVSPFARSVASHVRALVDGGSSRALYDKREAEWESRFELDMILERERKRQQRIDRITRPHLPSLDRRRNCHRTSTDVTDELDVADMDTKDATATDITLPSDNLAESEEILGRKRKRSIVNYKELYDKMKREGEILS